MEQQKTGLNSNQLKLIALFAMTVDHVTSVVVPGYPKTWWVLLLHIVGRLAAPIFWFMVAEGYAHTRNLKKYIGRLFAFAVISHFAYNFAFGIPFLPLQTTVFNQTSVIWSLAWGVVAVAVSEDAFFPLKQWQKVGIILGICVISFCSDWSCIAVLAILEIYSSRGNLKKQTIGMMKWVAVYAAVYAVFIDRVYGLLQLFVLLVVPFVRQYNGDRGTWKGMKWFFYLYYPAHLVVCGLIRLWLHGNMGVIIGG